MCGGFVSCVRVGEVMQWTRVLDTEEADPAQLTFHAQQFISAIRALFGECQCTSIFGYTQVMLDVLRTPIVWTVDGKTRTIGSVRGCPDAIVDACLARMANWVTLATAAVHAEFPSFELSQAFEWGGWWVG